MVWPYGRYTGPGLEVAKQLGFSFSLTLEAEAAYTSDLFAIHRYFPTRNPSLGEIADNLRFDAPQPRTALRLPQARCHGRDGRCSAR